MSSIRFTRNQKKLRVVLLSVILVSIIAYDDSEGQADTTSVWRGVVEDAKDGPIAAELRISSDKYKLHYDVPRSCSLDARQVSESDEKTIFRFSKASGGFCDDIYQGTMTIEKLSQKKWSVQVEKKSIEFSERFSLTNE